MSQFCGSFAALINRCGVTSAAIAGMVSAARPIDERAARIVLSGISFLPACCDRREFLCAVALKSRGSDCAVLASPARTRHLLTLFLSAAPIRLATLPFR